MLKEVEKWGSDMSSEVIVEWFCSFEGYDFYFEKYFISERMVRSNVNLKKFQKKVNKTQNEILVKNLFSKENFPKIHSFLRVTTFACYLKKATMNSGS